MDVLYGTVLRDALSEIEHLVVSSDITVEAVSSSARAETQLQHLVAVTAAAAVVVRPSRRCILKASHIAGTASASCSPCKVAFETGASICEVWIDV